ncbi:MAG: hypothetical protein WA618_18825, partial [Terriglobales bacterium]
HAEQDVERGAVSESGVALDEAIAEKCDPFTSLQIDCQKASLPNIDVAQAMVGKRGERHVGARNQRVRCADDAPEKLRFFDGPVLMVGEKLSRKFKDSFVIRFEAHCFLHQLQVRGVGSGCETPQ